ncbi:NUMOD4 domain-containing protein [Chryseobacterium sp. JUb7]|uniref:NUMOD4 domain-containing protein n=1 Tax=Chryseobacterium sp. JUb7 TaxID=2940599 RepID=UPI002166EAD9|nr:NUMOD4 domain-containing protein [Chryseobacterium sp. JUb7]MCS3533054.1 hypothetical protein [Chryseobacterium sp. JUb7]
MALPKEFENEYVRKVLYNTSLKNLPNEEWKLIDDFGGYAISNYGRVKSLERWVSDPLGRKRKASERIMKLQFMKFFNKYLNRNFYNITCLLSSQGKRYRKSVARLVYHHFVQKLDIHEESYLISFKDNDRFHIHVQNLEKLSISRERFKRVETNRVKNHYDVYHQPITQYTVEGLLVATFDDIDSASKKTGIHPRYLFLVINNERITAGGFRWFLKQDIPPKDSFSPNRMIENTFSDPILNTSLWKKLGQPLINKSIPPACMNLSPENLPGEIWKPLPGFINQFSISNKGRIKRLEGWTQSKNKRFLKEHIISLFIDCSSRENYYFYTNLNCNGKRIQIRINRLLYYCFVKKFDLKNKALVIVNKNNPKWDLDVANLELESASAHLMKISEK